MWRPDKFRHRALTMASCALVVLFAGATPGKAAPGDEASPTAALDVDYAAAERLVQEKRFAEALPLLARVVARDPANADAHNLLGFSQRKLGFLGEALVSYRRALELDPDHIGAHEYLGELHTEQGDLGRAEEHLARLAQLCPLGCEARDDLARAIASRKGTKSN
jgi:Flp pilus assembly protein TadD